ncbi:NAD(P)-binding protein [Mycena crocata]|nr:NAD(P)-binding protein [Mycena crocata]
MGISFSKNFNPSTDIGDLSGKVAIVTGGNSGIGYSTVKFLARRGAKVYLAARNENYATAAITKLEKQGLGTGQIIFLKLNLSDPRLARKSAEEFATQEKRLDILVNNAGLLTDSKLKSLQTADGISEMMASNYIGPYVFTRTLLDLLKSTAQESESDVRIVNLSSHMHRMTKAGTNFGDAAIFHDECKNYMTPGFARYAVSKYATNLWTIELQRRLDESLANANHDGRGIIVMSVHPGAVNTFARFLPMSRIFDFIIGLFMTSPDDGASTSLFAAAAPIVRAEPEKYRGQYLLPVGKLANTSATKDTEMARKLWENTETYLQGLGV